MNPDILNSGPAPALPGQYHLLPLEKLIKDNVQSLADLERLHCALGILIKYGRNLLKGTQRPKMWNRVNFTNKVFSAKVDCIKGCRQILSSLGYTEKTPEGVSFPENVEPDIPHVKAVVTELHVAQKELDAYIEHRHPQPAWIDTLLPNTIMFNTSGGHQGAECLGGASSGSSVDPPTFVDHGASAAMQAPNAGGQLCDICGGNAASWHCVQCEQKVLCDNCDDMWHKHPKRRQHRRNRYTPSQAPEGAAPEAETILPALLSCFESEHESQSGSPNKQSAASNNTQAATEHGVMAGGFSNVGGARPKTTNHTPIVNGTPKANDFTHSNASPSPKAIDSPWKDLNADSMKTNDAVVKNELGLELKNLELRRAKLLQQSYDLELNIKRLDKQLRQIIISNKEFIREPQYKEIFAKKETLERQKTEVDAEFKLLADASHQHLGAQFSKGEPQSVPLPVLERQLGNATQSMYPGTVNQSSMYPYGNQGDVMYAPMTTPYHGVQHAVHNDKQGVVSPEFVAALGMEQPNRPQQGQYPLTPPLNVAETANLGVPPAATDWTCKRCTYVNSKPCAVCEMCVHPRPSQVEMEKENEKKSIIQRGVGWMKGLMGKGSSVKEGKVENGKQQLPNTDTPVNKKTPQPALPPASDAWREAAKGLDHEDIHGRLTETYRKKQEQQEQMEIRRIVQILRNAERDGFTPAEMEHAWPRHGINGAPSFLRGQWADRIALALSDLEDYPGRDQQVRQLLIENNGDVKTVMEKARKFDKEMQNYLQTLSDLPADTVATFVQADKENAKKQLIAHKLKLIKDRVWSPDQPLNNEECNQRLEALIKNKDIDQERRVRATLVEKNMAGWARADMVVAYAAAVNSDIITLEDVVQAARDCWAKNDFRRYLENECPICIDLYPVSKMRLLGMCQDSICIGCFREHFEISIKERAVLKLVCPVCGLPDMADREECQDYFTLLELQFRDTLSREVFDLFEKKVRDWHLQSDPNFCWCSHCDNGILNDAQLLKIRCNNCGKLTCFKCKKPWQPQHEGLTCEKFYEWQKANDPEFQKAGLEKHLAENGIECPNCKFRYALAKGGCIHFTCTQCKFEFCCGCRMPFRKGGPCRNLPVCQGLHCHHPRDCLYYLRDWDVAKLQKLLMEKAVAFLTEKMLNGEDPNQQCTVMEQKELPDGLRDEACGRAVLANHAGLCLVHYKEYLVSLINQNHIDPVVEMDLVELQQTLHRTGIQVPDPFANEQDIMYLGRLRMIITEQIPLPAPQ